MLVSFWRIADTLISQADNKASLTNDNQLIKIMRKITNQIVSAFIAGKSKSSGNSSTDGNAMFLHGNKIAEKRDGKLWVTLAGWNTATTRERVNGLLREAGLTGSFNQKDFEPYFNGKLVSSNEWICVQ